MYRSEFYIKLLEDMIIMPSLFEYTRVMQSLSIIELTEARCRFDLTITSFVVADGTEARFK